MATTNFEDFYQVPNLNFDISKLRKDLDNAKLPQVVGQQLLLRNNGFPIQKTHLCEWTPHHFRVWEILPNHNLEKHLLNELKVFTDALLYGKTITDKPKTTVRKVLNISIRKLK